jgi:hypothetical protein
MVKQWNAEKGWLGDRRHLTIVGRLGPTFPDEYSAGDVRTV